MNDRNVGKYLLKKYKLPKQDAIDLLGKLNYYYTLTHTLTHSVHISLTITNPSLYLSLCTYITHLLSYYISLSFTLCIDHLLTLFTTSLYPSLYDMNMSVDINPLNQYKDIGMLSHFLTEMGTIKSRKETGLNQKNQYFMSKAVKRAR